MNIVNWLPLIIFACSFLTGVTIFFIKEEAEGLRTFINILNAVIKIQ